MSADLLAPPPAPQLLLLANVVTTMTEEEEEEKEMMELKTVDSYQSYHGDSEDEEIIRYSCDAHIPLRVEFAASPAISSEAADEVVGGAKTLESPPPAVDEAPPPVQIKCKPAFLLDGVRKKKPLLCKPCDFQAESEQELMEHLNQHSLSKMELVHRVEGLSRTSTKTSGSQEPQAEPSGDAGEASGDAKGLIRCERCGYNTNRYDHYIAHLKHHNKEGEDDSVFQCTLCPYTTVSKYHWRKHLRNHFPSKLHTCNQCSYFSDRKSNYIQHIRTHTGVRPFQCPYCDYSSSQKTHLTRHMRTHSGERPFKCDSCSYLAANQHEVTRHARQVHNGPKPLSCPYCEYKTADRSNFKKHVELHVNPRQFSCPLCKYAASKKCNLQYHLKSRHSGCDVSMDVSMVKLKKKPGAVRSHELTVLEEEEEEEDSNKDWSPINLSVEKSGRSSVGQSLQTDVTSKAQRKSAEQAPKDREPEKRVTTRQRKTEKTSESSSVRNLKRESVKAKRRAKKLTNVKEDAPQIQEEPTDQTTHPEPKETNGDKPNKNKTVNKPRKSRSKRLETKKDVQTFSSPEESPRGTKRKAGDVLDLSTKSKTQRVNAGPIHESRPVVSPGPEIKTKTKRKKQNTPSSPEAESPAEIKNPSVTESNPSVTEPDSSVPGPASEKACSDSPSPTEERGPFTFLKPSRPVVPRTKPSDHEDDEGIHSSHEGGSDISDSSSEGSDDSGLNSTEASSAKMANDPETPTDEIPTPTELKSHTCVFCDRTFPLEVTYRRHLNRHLVNVYYMDTKESTTGPGTI
ncbi:RE1-silencing transcription factor [Gouania willdenowi]|nr:RE1-silencing transcription factor [Gouania willdenowi]